MLTVKRGDTVTLTLTANGDLSTATGVRVLVSRQPGRAPAVVLAPASTSFADGKTTVTVTTEFAIPGRYLIEVEATEDDVVATWPSSKYAECNVQQDLG